MGFLDTVTRGLEAGLTGGLSEFGRDDPFGVPGAGQYVPLAATIGAGFIGGPGAGAAVGGFFSAQQQAQAQKEANATNMAIADRQMAFSAAQAKNQMEFQERMSGTAYQRQAADMRAAGINPVVGFGGGASSPSGASGSSAGATVAPVPSVLANAISSARDSMSVIASVKNAMAQYENIQADTTKKIADTAKVAADTKAVGASTTATQLSNTVKARQLDVEKAHPKIFGILDSIMSRLPFFHSAVSAYKAAQ